MIDKFTVLSTTREPSRTMALVVAPTLQRLATLLLVLLVEQGCDAFVPRYPLALAPVARMSHPSVIVWSAADDSDASPARMETPKAATETSAPILLYVLDALTLLVFAAVGKASHASDGSLDLVATATTAAPFIAGWFLSSPLTGVYSPVRLEKGSSVKDVVVSSFLQTTKGWIVAIPLGCVGRGIIKGYVPPVPFVIVTLVATLVLLGVTRAVYAVVSYKLQDQTQS